MATNNSQITRLVNRLPRILHTHDTVDAGGETHHASSPATTAPARPATIKRARASCTHVPVGRSTIRAISTQPRPAAGRNPPTGSSIQHPVGMRTSARLIQHEQSDGSCRQKREPRRQHREMPPSPRDPAARPAGPTVDQKRPPPTRICPALSNACVSPATYDTTSPQTSARIAEVRETRADCGAVLSRETLVITAQNASRASRTCVVVLVVPAFWSAAAADPCHPVRRKYRRCRQGQHSTQYKYGKSLVFSWENILVGALDAPTKITPHDSGCLPATKTLVLRRPVPVPKSGTVSPCHRSALTLNDRVILIPVS